jgi:predicted DNA-binding protein (MmcQ/YjbR family)
VVAAGTSRVKSRDMKLAPRDVLAELRRICLALPGATETVTFGNPTFQVHQKTFCVLEDYRGELSVCFKVGKQEQAAFLKDPRFYRTPYVGHHGWVSLRINAAPLDWNEVSDLATTSHQTVSAGRSRRRAARIAN